MVLLASTTVSRRYVDSKSFPLWANVAVRAGENTLQPAAFKADAMSHEKFSLSLSPAPYHTPADCGAKELTADAKRSCCALVSLRGSILACRRASSRFAAAACWFAIDVALFASAIACFASSW